MIILGIETSCDDTAASLLEISGNKPKVITSIISSQVKIHVKYGGVFPSLAAREHIKNLPKVINLALKEADLEISEVDLIAVTRGPGLVSSLLVGMAFAQTLAWKYSKPIIGINHLEGHIASTWLNETTTPSLPAICLIVSGGHTELVLIKKPGSYKIVGQTLDDAAGEAFDKIARILGLGYPGGPAIDKAAVKDQTKKIRLKIELPRPMINSKNFDFSFSGLKTAVLYLTRDLKKIKPLTKKQKTAIATETQHAIIDVLVNKTLRAAMKYKVKSVMLSGGVSANKTLRDILEQESHKLGMRFYKPEMQYTTDNAAMIALAGYWNYKSKKQKTDIKSVVVNANLSI